MNLPLSRKTGKIENPATDPGSYKFTTRTKRKRTENANETNEKRTNASHERYEKRTIHETNARYTKRMHDTRTNESLERTCNHILSNDKRSWFYRGTI